MDTPKTDSWDELKEIAEDRKAWREKVRKIMQRTIGKRNTKDVNKSKVKRKLRMKTRSMTRAMEEEVNKNSTDDSDDDGHDSDEWSCKKRQHKEINNRVVCRDGFELIIQASSEH